MDHTENHSEKIDLIGILSGMLRYARRLWALALVLALLGAGAMGYHAYSSYTPVYEASMTFTVQVANPLYSSIRVYNEKTAQQMAATFPYILTSSALQQQVREYLGISYVPTVTASVISNSNIFTMSVRDSDPQRAYDVLSAVVACYPTIADYVVGPTSLVLLDDPGVPTEPTNQLHITNACIIGAVLGLTAWLAYVLLLTATRTTVRSEEDLARVLNSPCLGQIPVTKIVGKAQICPLFHKDRGKYGFSEAIRMLRLHTQREIVNSGKKVLMVSSAIPSEGKTTVSVNLALSLAEDGKQVLLLDCDPYNPSVFRALSTERKNTVGTFSFGKAGKKANLHRVSDRTLFTASMSGPKGNAPLNLSPAELTDLVEDVRNTFDYIILDTPPCSLLTDAAEMAGAADCGLMVVRQDFASRDQILDGARLLTDSGLPLLGCVLNGVSAKNGYSYGYGSGYGYGYGYGHGYSYGRDEDR